MTFTYPYLITSDQHAHNWSQFAGVDEGGVNTRLQAILNEMTRAHGALLAEGGDTSFYGGDLFHVRGRIEPSVFNPTFETIKGIHTHTPGLKTYAIPGNHDLEGKNADALGNAMQALSSIEGFKVFTTPNLVGDVLVIPWFQDLNELRDRLADAAGAFKAAGRLDQTDVIIHAPVNGIIKGIPDHGLEASELAAYGFRRVFSGHYHDHKVMEDGKVISIGATTHQTWNDPGSLAGFLLVWPDRIEHVPTAAPLFIDLHDHEIEGEAELKALVAGNYVRFKVDDVTASEVEKWREDLKGAGALGSIILANKKKPDTTRTGTTVTASKSLEASVAEFVANQLKPADVVSVQKLCADLIAQARSAS
jgi:DNA repair exonuclease SbcCD nuclease subunit